ncbi:hypothetical protein KP509_15G044200 [Ceratopteris richardii]|uniref:Growth-regulating factor n=1 Tax=Ceratopteris richardii TaxID=49495 RepID=A0A8T2T6K6_CERRI|nr:hypothetical protein KP509_15G044200 [Ceratopteris richardii]
MDLKQVLQHRGAGGGGCHAKGHLDGAIVNNGKSSALSPQSDGGNNSTCSNASSARTETGESHRGPSPAATLLQCGGPPLMAFHESSSQNRHGGRNAPACQQLNLVRPRPGDDIDTNGMHGDPRLKLIRLHDLPCNPHSSLETQVLINLNGNGNFNCGNADVVAADPHGQISPFMCNNDNPANPPTNYSGASSDAKIYPFASLQEGPSRQHHSPFLLSAIPSPQATVMSSARSHHAAVTCFNQDPAPSLFSQEQLLELAQQTYIWKLFAAGLTPPHILLLPIINSVAAMGRIGFTSMHLASNAGLFGVGGLRGTIDPEPGRCRRTDGKKWRCAREVVADQKYCERHMHRGRHRARGNKLASGSVDASNSTPSTLSTVTTCTVAQSGNGSNPSISASFGGKEPHLQFSLQTAATQHNRFDNNNNSGSNSNSNNHHPSDPSGLKRLLESNIGGPRNLTAQSESSPSPNLPALFKANGVSDLAVPKCQSQALQSTLPFSCHGNERQADSLGQLRHLVDGDHWSRMGRTTSDPPPASSLPWLDHLAEEQSNKRSRFSTELSIATHNSPLVNLSSKFGGAQSEDLVDVDAAHFMALGMDAGSKVVVGKLEDEDRYSGRSAWLPTSWESPAIGGPLGEALQANGANSGGSYGGGGLSSSGADRCLNLIEEESWVHQEAVARSTSPAKGSHSPSLASPTGVLQMKASFTSYSDSSSSASSPRSALKLESAALGI